MIRQLFLYIRKLSKLRNVLESQPECFLAGYSQSVFVLVQRKKSVHKTEPFACLPWSLQVTLSQLWSSYLRCSASL